MVDYLVKLMEEGEYQKCLRLAEQQLLKGGMSWLELTKINLVICRSRLGLNDPSGAIISGLLAIKMSRDVKEWDLLGRAQAVVGMAYVRTRQYDEALHHLYGYFEHLHKYTTSRRLEGSVWKSIGIAHQHKLESQQAIKALNRAWQWFARQDADHSTFGCLHDLVNTYLQMHHADPSISLEPVAALLQVGRQLVKKHAGDAYFQATHFYDRAAYYMHLRSYKRAMVCAMKAMEIRKRDPYLAFHCHMVLHECTKSLGDAKQALGYALAARVQALQGRHYDLEFIAAQAMVDLIRLQGADVVRALDEEYQAMGIDLGQYLSPAMLHRPN